MKTKKIIIRGVSFHVSVKDAEKLEREERKILQKEINSNKLAE